MPNIIKIVSVKNGKLVSLSYDSPFAKTYREKDGSINTVKSSLVFTNSYDAAMFTTTFFPFMREKEIWIASADTIEPRDWMFSSRLIYDFHFLCPFHKEACLEAVAKAEIPEDNAFVVREREFGRTAFVTTAPKGTALATSLKLEKQIDIPILGGYDADGLSVKIAEVFGAPKQEMKSTQ